MASEQGVPVDLYIYDLTNGLAAMLSPAIIDEQPLLIREQLDEKELGRQVEGVWHTAVVVYDREYFYGAGGITSCEPGGTQLGAPLKIERLGETFVPRQLFVDYLQGLSATTYSGADYRLLEHNCNHFSDEVAQFLCGARVPKHILEQPGQLPPPLRLALTALTDNMLRAGNSTGPAQLAWDGGVRTSRGARADSPDYLTLNTQIEQARAAGAELDKKRSTLAEKLARKERRAEKKRHKHGGHPPAAEMADGVEVEVQQQPAAVSGGAGSPGAAGGSAGPSSGSGASLTPDADARYEQEMRRREVDPPIVYKDIDGAAEFEKLSAALEKAELSPEERTSLDELQQYLVQGEGSWVLGDDFLAFIGRILTDDSLSGARLATLRCLAACALKEDVSLILHQDRRHHALLSYAQRIDTLPVPEQEALAMFMCNLFENLSSSEWLLYISEWESASGQPLSNIRCTTKVCVHAALAEGQLREYGTALMYNVATKEVKTVRLRAGGSLRPLLPATATHKVFDEVCVELGMALLQLLAWAPGEEHAWRALRALARLAQHSADVPQLVAMVGPDPAAFRGTSARIDEQIDLIAARLK